MMLGDSFVNGGTRIAATQTRASTAVWRERPLRDGGQHLRRQQLGPSNPKAHIQQFGLFDPDVVVLVLNSKDWHDVRRWQYPAGRRVNFPSKSPMFAIGEAVTRYLLRYAPAWMPLPWQWFSQNDSPAMAPPSTQPTATAEAPTRALIRLIQKRDVPLVIAMHPARSELLGNWNAGRNQFQNLLESMGLELYSLDPAFERAIDEGKVIYRDGLHPNEQGQAVMAEALLPKVIEALRRTGEVPATQPTRADGRE